MGQAGRQAEHQSFPEASRFLGPAVLTKATITPSVSAGPEKRSIKPAGGLHRAESGVLHALEEKVHPSFPFALAADAIQEFVIHRTVLLEIGGGRGIGSKMNRRLYGRTACAQGPSFAEYLSRLARAVSSLLPGQDSAGEGQS